jgi:acetyl esterase/lipase
VIRPRDGLAAIARLLVVPLLLLVAVVAAGCALPPPQGDPPLRYRDAVFSTTTEQRDLVYGSAPDNAGNPVTLKLDLHQPTGDVAARRPAVVWVHGGGFCCGSKIGMWELSNTYAKLGYVAVTIDYRLLAPSGCGGTPNPTPECVTAAIAAQHDAQAAVRWLRRQANTNRIDTDRIAIGGSSAGAVTSLLVGTRSEDPGSSGNPGFPSTARGVVSISGGLPTNEWISQGDAATIFFHGTNDNTVPFAWAQSNSQAMRAAGVPVILNAIQGAGHDLWTNHRNFITTQSKYFLYYMMDLGNAAQSQ